MTEERHSFHWRPREEERRELPLRLREALKPLVLDRASSSDALVREFAALFLDWLAEGAAASRGHEGAQRDGLDWATLHRVWTTDVQAFRESHAWRAPLAHFLETMDALPRFARDAGIDAPPREVVAEELGLWLGGLDATHPANVDAPSTWSGEPLASGPRLPDRTACVRAFEREFQRGEIVCVHGYSSTVVAVLSLLAQRGLDPHVVLSEGVPDLGGRRMAKELVPLGVRVRLCYDAALPAELPRADRVWIGTEAIGPDGLLGRVGTTILFQEARRHEVPTAVLATADKWMPRGELVLPQWCERDPWLLWESAPEGVELESQAFERVPLSLVDAFATEEGYETAPQFSLRALRTHGAFASLTT